jgi:hypothetical protein
MKKNSNLSNAKKAKQDEFYTRIEDIEKEVIHYKDQLKGKTIFCNCDDPEFSNFWKYFYLNFEHFGLKKLISTHFETNTTSYKLEYRGGNNIKFIRKTELQQNGDFRSPESIEILKETDIVITNPPFSLFRQYIAQLIQYDKKFLVVGNNNAITYKEIFPLIKDNKLWLGYSSNKTMEFQLPNHYEKWNRVDENGNKYGKVPAISWFTNLPTTKRQEELILTETYDPSKYPKYDNYDAINVDKVKDIPVNYYKTVGVPITYLDKHNPSQFEILGMTKTPICFNNHKDALRIKTYKNVMQKSKGKEISGNKVNDGATILIDNIPDKTYYTSDNINGYLIVPYARILIRRVK